MKKQFLTVAFPLQVTLLSFLAFCFVPFLVLFRILKNLNFCPLKVIFYINLRQVRQEISAWNSSPSYHVLSARQLLVNLRVAVFSLFPYGMYLLLFLNFPLLDRGWHRCGERRFAPPPCLPALSPRPRPLPLTLWVCGCLCSVKGVEGWGHFEHAAVIHPWGSWMRLVSGVEVTVLFFFSCAVRVTEL